MAARPGTQPDIPPEPPEDGDIDSPPINSDIKDKPTKKNKGEKKGKGGIIAIVIVVLLLGGIVLIMALNLFGFREDVVMPYLRNAPLIGSFFPDPEEDPLAELTPEQLRSEHTQQALQIESLEDQIRRLTNDLQSANAQILDLSRFRDDWLSFLTAQAQLGQLVAHHDPQVFLNFLLEHHNLINVNHIPQLIEEASILVAHDNEIMELVRTLSRMDESAAGEILEHWMLTDTLTMIRVIRAMGATLRGEILETLEPTVRANMLLLSSVPPPTFTPLMPNLHELPPFEGVPVLPIITIPEPEEELDDEEIFEEYEIEEDEEDEEIDDVPETDDE